MALSPQHSLLIGPLMIFHKRTFHMNAKIVAMLDRVANDLEAAGHIRFAGDVDAIANTVEAAFGPPEVQAQQAEEKLKRFFTVTKSLEEAYATSKDAIAQALATGKIPGRNDSFLQDIDNLSDTLENVMAKVKNAPAVTPTASGVPTGTPTTGIGAPVM